MAKLGCVMLAGMVAAGSLGCATELTAHGHWCELASDHFRLATDVDAAAARRQTTRLETVLAGLGARLRPGRPLPARIDVLWLRHGDDVQALGVEWARGFYVAHQGDEPSTPPLIVVGGASNHDLEQNLAHELTHALLVDAAPLAPAWLAEGLASYYGTLDLDRGTIGFDDNEQSLELLNGAHAKRWASVEGLLGRSFDVFHSVMISDWLYATARALVAMMQSEPDLRPRFERLLLRLGERATAREAWAESFAGVSTAELQSRMERFFVTRATALPLPPWRGTPSLRPLPPSAVERWFGRARPWDSREALVAAGKSLARAAAGGDDSAERHYWSGVYAATWHRWSEAEAELRAALARDADMTAASSALARVTAARPPRSASR